jgi:ATP-binding cassette subfamily F protein uup
LLLDEPTNHLDADSIRWLEAFLATYTGAVIFVTHDRYFLDVIATRIIEIDQGKAYSHPGNYTAFLESKALRQQIASQTERRRQRFLREELEWVRAGVKARTTKSRSRLDKFYEIDGIKAPVEEQEMDILIPPPPNLGNTVIELEDVGINVGSSTSPRWLFKHLDLIIRPGECTGIVGRNGVGKTTLLKICLDQLDPSEGKSVIGKRVKVNYIDQARMALDGTGSLLDEVADGNEKVLFGDEWMGARSYLKRFLFSDVRINERVDLLSGGERARLMLAKVLKTGGNLLVLDEPTNDLDLPSLRMLEEALADFGGSVIVVSHDRYFLDRICDRIIAFEDNGVHITPGNYSYYLEKRQQRENSQRIQAAAAAKEAAARKKAKAPSDDKPRKLTLAEKKELETIEDRILEAEEAAAAIETKLNDPDFQTNHFDEAPKVVAELEAAKQAAAALYSRWEALEALAYWTARRRRAYQPKRHTID